MMRLTVILMLIVLLTSTVSAQVLNKAEYFFDADPGIGNGTSLAITSGATINSNFAININALATGFHSVNIRLKDSNGKWSMFVSRTFYLSPLNAMTSATTIKKAEYFFDTDPGDGNATPVAVSNAATINQTIVIPTTSLTPGFHNLNFRVKDDQGHWAIAAIRTFYLTPTISVGNATTITKAEYFMDNDPGIGKATTIAVSASGTINQTIITPTTSLSPGFHNLNFRVRDNNGIWSIVQTRTFYLIPPPPSGPAPNLVKAEYFLDTDPGPGKGNALTITAATTENNTFPIDVSSFTGGFHRIGVRYKDNRNQWSIAQVRTFYVIPANTGASKIVSIEYFVDQNPTVTVSASGKKLSITPAASIDQAFVIDLSGTPQGNHILYIRAKDDSGYLSAVTPEPFTILACTPPTAPTSPGASRCGPGTVTLNASGSAGAQVYHWYADAGTSTVLQSGNGYVTPSLAANKDFYVSIYDPGTLCESNRTKATATVKFADKPVINPSGSVNLCQGNTILLSAPIGFTQYKWSTGDATQQILVSGSGKYAVQIGDGTCTGPTSDTVSVTVVAGPAKPTVTVTGNTTICGTGSVDMKGPDGVTYQWSTGESTQTITVTQTGLYYLIVKTGGGCPSLPSDPIAVSVQTPPCGGGGGGDNQPPTIDARPLASQIEGKVEVDLTKLVSDADNNIDYSSLKIINNETSRGATTTVDNSYVLTINYEGMPFTGTDRITLQVCDLDGACAEQVIDIDIVGEVVVFNGLSPNNDGVNDKMEIKYIGVVDGTTENVVTIFNRWGDEVYKASNYDNVDRVFTGKSNSGNDLPSGTYFYEVKFGSGGKLNGYITLIR